MRSRITVFVASTKQKKSMWAGTQQVNNCWRLNFYPFADHARQCVPTNTRGTRILHLIAQSGSTNKVCHITQRHVLRVAYAYGGGKQMRDLIINNKSSLREYLFRMQTWPFCSFLAEGWGAGSASLCSPAHTRWASLSVWLPLSWAQKLTLYEWRRG